MIRKINVKIWIILHAFFMIVGGIGVSYLMPLSAVLVGGLLSFLVLIFLGKTSLQQWTPYAGYANWITFARLALLIVTAAKVEQLLNIQLFVLFSLCLLLDGIDGKVARYYQQESKWGALFDKEVDSFFVLVIALILYKYFGVPIWILAIGLLHYLYELVLYFLNWQHLITKKNPVGRYVAFLLFVSLLAPIAINQSWVLTLVGVASVFTLVSFGISFVMKYTAAREREKNEFQKHIK